MIETQALTKRFGRHLAVDGLTMSLQEPGVVGFLGPNGAGKSTTIRMLTGALASTSGTARVAGFDVFDQPRQARARLGYLPETGFAPAMLTVGEAIRYAAELRGLRRVDRVRRAGEVMEQVGLLGAEQRLVDALAWGYRKRLGLALALVHDPKVLVLDEPMTGLDPQNIQAFRRLIADVAQDRLVLLSTHVLSEAASLCSQVVLIHAGRLLAEGPVAALADRVGLEDWVEFALDSPQEDVSARIAGLDVVEQVRQEAAGEYRVRGTQEVEPALAALAGVHGWRLRRLRRAGPTLEDVFVALVERA